MATVHICNSFDQSIIFSVVVKNTAAAKEEDARTLIDAYDEWMNASRFPDARYEQQLALVESMGVVAGIKAAGYRIVVAG